MNFITINIIRFFLVKVLEKKTLLLFNNPDGKICDSLVSENFQTVFYGKEYYTSLFLLKAK